jgi:nucleotide-binding universal stress UspA family protein
LCRRASGTSTLRRPTRYGLAQQAGFQPQSLAIEAAPTWKGIVKVAEERGASIVVLGSHRRSGLVGHLLGSVTAAVVAHTALAVLVVHQ